MSLSFDAISSPGATRDLFIDLTAALESNEVLTLATVESAYPTVVSVSNVATNYETTTIDERIISSGKGVHLTVSTLQESHAAVPIIVTFEGDSGTCDRYEIIQPIVPSLCS